MAFRLLQLKEDCELWTANGLQPLLKDYQFVSYMLRDGYYYYSFLKKENNIGFDSIHPKYVEIIKVWKDTTLIHLLTKEEYHYDGKSPYSGNYTVTNSKGISQSIKARFLTVKEFLTPTIQDGSYSSIDHQGKSWRDRPPLI